MIERWGSPDTICGCKQKCGWRSLYAKHRRLWSLHVEDGMGQVIREKNRHLEAGWGATKSQSVKGGSVEFSHGCHAGYTRRHGALVDRELPRAENSASRS